VSAIEGERERERERERDRESEKGREREKKKPVVLSCLISKRKKKKKSGTLFLVEPIFVGDVNVDVVDVHHRRRRRRLFTRCRDAGDIWRPNGELKKAAFPFYGPF
jgi:hypothetical protein